MPAARLVGEGRHYPRVSTSLSTPRSDIPSNIRDDFSTTVPPRMRLSRAARVNPFRTASLAIYRPPDGHGLADAASGSYPEAVIGQPESRPPNQHKPGHPAQGRHPRPLAYSIDTYAYKPCTQEAGSGPAVATMAVLCDSLTDNPPTSRWFNFRNSTG